MGGSTRNPTSAKVVENQLSIEPLFYTSTLWQTPLTITLLLPLLTLDHSTVPDTSVSVDLSNSTP